MTTARVSGIMRWQASGRATYALNVDDPIFEGLRQDYDSFDEWFEKVRRESGERRCYLVEEDTRYAALALLKPESDCEYDFAGPVLKISTFKVSSEHSGLKFGELLLKAILTDISADDTATLFVEVLPSHPEVMDFLDAFGFFDSGYRNSRESGSSRRSCGPGRPPKT